MADNTANISQVPSAPPSIKLPKINIPPFSGDYVEWQSFYDLYCTTIHEKDYLTASQKFQYLKGLLRGEAASLLRHFSITEANYVEAVQKLTQRYDRKRHTVNAFIKTFLDQSQVNQATASSIRKLWDTSDEVVRGLKALGPNAEHRDPWLIHIMMNKLDSESKGLWAQQSAEKDFPTLKEFFEFLGRRTDALESVSRSATKRSNQPTTSKLESAKAFATIAKPSCPICNCDEHKLFECGNFKKMNTDKRWELIRNERRCFNCFNPNHGTYQCKSRFRCRQCSKKHHTLLHAEEEDSGQTASKPSTSSNITESQVMQVSSGESQVILPTALVRIKDGFGNFQTCRALLDSTSQESFITEDCAQNLSLPRSNGRLLMKGLGGAALGNSRGRMELSIRPAEGDDLKVRAFIIPKISAKLPTYDFKISDWNKLERIQLADPKFNRRSSIDVLLGTEVFYEITQGDKIKLGDRLIAEKTSFGWVVAGRSIEQRNNNESACFSVTTNVDDTLRKFWEIEAVAVAPPFTAEEQQCEELFRATTKRTSDGKFVVQLPLRETESQLGSTYRLAMSRLSAMEQRFKRDHAFHQLYDEFMAEYEKLGHLIEIPTDMSLYYLPHHGVLKSASTTTKLRVVFDASAKSSTGVSFNDILCIGPTVQSTLVDILLRFRRHRFVVTGDVEKMYRQIWVREADTKHQNILWRKDPTQRPKTFRLKTLTYGTAPASYLATRCLNELAMNARERTPIAAAAILNDMYVDDLMTGANTEAELANLKDAIVSILVDGGFNLRKFSTNSTELRKQLEITIESMKEINENPALTKLLGVNWDPITDFFSFQVQIDQRETHTKRSLLSEASKIFDPIGWLAPVIVRVKILFQRLWLQKLEWDDPLPSDIASRWDSMRSDLANVNQIRIPRWLGTQGNIELHGFCDSSEMAYAAAIFNRAETETGMQTHLIAAKTKVAPLKAVSVPRLELMGALLLTNLMNKVRSALGTERIARIVLWTDSKIVLDWLAAHPRRWPTFIANRASEILSSYNREQWMHVPSVDNPADCASRGMDAAALANFELWWDGPRWLRQPENEWPVQSSSFGTNEEAKPKVLAFNVTISNDILQDILSKYSSFFKMKRVMAYILRFGKNSRSPQWERNFNPLNRDDLNMAAVYLIRYTQQQYFFEEVRCLQANVMLPKSSKIKALNPFIDNEGIIRVGGRLEKSTLAMPIKHPILLSRKSAITTVILQDMHHKFYHAGASFMINFLRQQFWVIRAKDAIRQVLHKCVQCFKQKPLKQQQLMGNLPLARVEYVHPFHKVGLDYAGPFKVQLTRRRGQMPVKIYICIFVCLSTRAVHIECVTNLTTENFLGAFSRFIDRRGICSDVFSDNGTNFVGANRQLIELFDFLRVNTNKLSSSLLVKNINWHFIPAGSPTMGGIWEAAVKSTKTHLKRVVGEALLTLEEFSTLMTGIEAILNSRPLYATTSEELEVLTPGHFIIGRPLASLPERSIPDKYCLSRRWDTVKRIKQHFWHRWHRDYLITLQIRNKWKDKSPNLQINDIVLIQDEQLPPTQWALGRIIETHAGSDGYVRVASIKTSAGITKKHISKLCKLPIESTDSRRAVCYDTKDAT